ncbi:outer membrane protein [Bartonella sp. B17]
MNTKYLMISSVIALISTSVAQAADVTFIPEFSWTGFYLGGQVGKFSSDVKINDAITQAVMAEKGTAPKLSSFIGGVYAGYNMDLGDDLVFGIETDAVWTNREDTKRISSIKLSENGADAIKADFKKAGIKLSPSIEKLFVVGNNATDDFTFKEKWSGATRLRLGFEIADRVMLYIGGGIAYAQAQGVNTISVNKSTESALPEKDPEKNPEGDVGAQTLGENSSAQKPDDLLPIVNTRSSDPTTISGKIFDSTKMMVGYTLGAGVDFAMADNVILRAEYRHSDFGKAKFAKNLEEVFYKTNDFRIGLAYKF